MQEVATTPAATGMPLFASEPEGEASCKGSESAVPCNSAGSANFRARLMAFSIAQVFLSGQVHGCAAFKAPTQSSQQSSAVVRGTLRNCLQTCWLRLFVVMWGTWHESGFAPPGVPLK